MSGSKKWIAAALASALVCALAFADPPPEEKAAACPPPNRPRAEPAANREDRQDLKKRKPVPCPVRPPGDGTAPGDTGLEEAAAEHLANAIPDGHVAARGGGFVTLVKDPAGDRLVAFDAAGKNPKDIARATKGPFTLAGSDGGSLAATGTMERWWLSPNGKTAAWVEQHFLFVSSTDGGTARALAAVAPGTPGFSPDGDRLALTLDGQLALFPVDGTARKLIDASEHLAAVGPAVFSPDGKRVFCLVAPNKAADADGIGVAEMGDASPTVKRLTETSQSHPSDLSISPDGRWLLFTQTPTNGTAPSLRAFATDASEFHTICRAAGFADATWSADGARAFFAAPGANGTWTVWEATLAADPATGEFPVRRLASTEKYDYRSPAVSADGKSVFAASRNLEGGAGATVARITLK